MPASPVGAVFVKEDDAAPFLPEVPGRQVAARGRSASQSAWRCPAGAAPSPAGPCGEQHPSQGVEVRVAALGVLSGRIPKGVAAQVGNEPFFP